MSEEQLAAEIAHLREQMKEIQTTLNSVKERVWTTHMCPKPGACLELEAWIRNHNEKFVDHETRMRSLEVQSNRIIGAVIIIQIVAVAAIKLIQ